MSNKTTYPGLVGMMKPNQRRNLALTCVALIALAAFLYLLENGFVFDAYIQRVVRLGAVYSIVALSLNLIQGYTGQFSLGSAGFMAVGAYATAVLSLPDKIRDAVYYLEPMAPWLAKIHLPFILALIVGGLLAGIVAFFIGFPVLRLKGDYLSIATLGFSEIIRIVLNNAQSVTNGATGLKSIDGTANVWWCFGILALVILFMTRLFRSSYGRAFMAIRDDEVAAEAMGIKLFKHKMMAFIASAVIAGIAGGLLASVMGAISPVLFKHTMSYDILLIMVLGGTGTMTGAVLGGFIFVIAKEALRFMDSGFALGPITVPSIAGLRMVVFSVLLMIIVLFYHKGLSGGKEFSWDRLFGFPKKVAKLFKKREKVGADK